MPKLGTGEHYNDRPLQDRPKRRVPVAGVSFSRPWPGGRFAGNATGAIRIAI